MSIKVGAACCAAAIAAFAVAWLVMRAAPRVGIVDRPSPRGSHARVTPRGGGVGIIVGTATGLALLIVLGIPPGQRLWIVVLGSLAMGVLGAVDDIRRLSPVVRLVLQVAIASAVAFSVGGVQRLPLPAPLDISTGLAAIPLGVLWLVATTNFYNFMDGIDSLAAGQAVASSAGIAIAGWSVDASNCAVLLGASALGFLPLNLPPAKLFLGDVGSTSIGFTLAGLALVAGPAQRPAAVLAVAVGLALFLLDPVETLARLVRRGHRVGVAHRLHSYQILARACGGHGRVSAAMIGAGFVLAIVGAMAFRVPILAWGAAGAAVMAFVIERYITSRAASPQPESPGD